MRSLFTKIFLSFWLACALFFMVAITATWIVRQQGEAGLDAAESKILSDAVEIYERSGTEAVHTDLEQIRNTQHIRAFLFNEKDEEISDHHPPDWVRDARRSRAITYPGVGRLIPVFSVQRQTITSSSGHHYSMVAIQSAPGPFGPHAPTWEGLLIGILSSGLVCYVLASYLTGPLVRLRTATQKLSSGDLSARAGITGSRRQDEIAQLVRDFDTMAERLEKLVNAQSRLLNDISHELRSPLARMNVALALARQRSGPDAQGMLDRIDVESARLNELIERLLTIARLEAAPEGVRKEEVQLLDLFYEIIEDADFEAQSRGIHVISKIAQPAEVHGNPALLHSAIENVVRNATQYTAPGTNVEVSLTYDLQPGKPQAVIRVADSGQGVPEDSLEKLFRPFYRIDDARAHTGGTGLGLAITDRAVRLHGGSVCAMNRSGGGLMVEIRLPLMRVPERKLLDTLEPSPAVPVSHES